MRVLLVKTSSLGDVVHNLPALEDLIRHHPQAEVDWLVEEGFADLPRLHPHLRRVIPVALRRWRRNLLRAATWQDIGAWRQALKGEAYDLVIDSQGLLKSALMARQARLAASGRRCGPDAASAREPLAARFYDQQIAVPRNLHAVERNRLLVASAAGYAVSGDADYGIRAGAAQWSWLPSGDYAVLLTATSRPDKEWPEADWLALASALLAAGLRVVLPSGSPAERARAARLAHSLGRAVAAPPMSIADLAGLLAGARLVVGVDTGLVHLAAALGRPTLALFCASDPGLTGVHAGPQAINLGARAAPPSAASAVSTALGLLTP
jgi:heptosyltransferase-1